jgi:hypothetical protein
VSITTRTQTNDLRDLTSYGQAEFREQADLSEAQFHGLTYLGGAQFYGRTDLSGAQFSGIVDLGGARFHGVADLSRSQFNPKCNLDNVSVAEVVGALPAGWTISPGPVDQPKLIVRTLKQTAGPAKAS